MKPKKLEKSRKLWQRPTRKQLLKGAKDYALGMPAKTVITKHQIFAPTVAHHKPKSFTENPIVVTELQRIRNSLATHNVTSDRIAASIDKGIDATRPVSAIIVGAKADERTNDFIEVPDWDARHKFVRLACRLLGFEVETTPASLELNISTFFQYIQRVEKERGLD